MKAFLVVFGLGFAALVLQGALALTIPPPWCPDLAWLVVIGIGLRWPGFLSGLLVAVPLGYAMDLLSGSLMGQHAFMRLISYLTAAVASRQLDLSGGVPVGIFVFVMTFVYGVGIAATNSFFAGAGTMSVDILTSSFGHAIANVVASGPMIALVERVVVRFSDDEVGRRAPLILGRSGGVIA